MEFPGITIGVLNSRKKYIDKTLISLQRQVYPTDLTQLVIVNNLDKAISIGKGFNQIAKKAQYDWILYLGDDDFLARTYLFCLAVFLRTVQERKDPQKLKAITTNLTLIDDQKRLPVDVAPTGMWNKQFLLKNPWDEKRKKYVDTEMFARIKEMDLTIARDHTNHGYYYRQHDTNVSDNKFTRKTKVIEDICNKNRRNLEYAG